jgi:4'-phosphopantetheinyl transferase
MTANGREALAPGDFAPAPAPPSRPPAAGEIHLWAVPLDPPPEREAALRLLLAADELARADRFRFDRHRRRFAVGRGRLRELLGGYLGVAPAVLAFGYGEKGKPVLAGPPAAVGGGLAFNLSNSHELALVAVAAGGEPRGGAGADPGGGAAPGARPAIELGVDVEHLRPMPDALAIAERYFSPAERRVLAAVPAAQRDEAFFNCWTRKEAYLKAIGDGLSVPLDRFDVTLAPGQPARFLALDGDPGRAARWSLFHLRPAPGYVGALAVPGAGRWLLRGGRWG